MQRRRFLRLRSAGRPPEGAVVRPKGRAVRRRRELHRRIRPAENHGSREVLRAWPWWSALRESPLPVRVAAGRLSGKTLERRAIRLSRGVAGSAGGYVPGKPGARKSAIAFERLQEAQESIGPRQPRLSAVRIPAGSNTLESQFIVTSWSSELENTMSETTGRDRRRKAYGSAGGKGSEG